jgi:hypothetical protein
MSSQYSKEAVKYPTKGIVLEDNFWNYGQKKTKTKVNIPVIMPLQEPAETTIKTEKKTNSRIKDTKVEQTVNYVEIYLPDFVYTYPTEEEIDNANKTLHGATSDYVPEGSDTPLDNGSNGEFVKGLARVVRKNTRLIIIFIDGQATPGNIKCIGGFDDAEEEKAMALALTANGNTGGISELTAVSATR